MLDISKVNVFFWDTLYIGNPYYKKNIPGLGMIRDRKNVNGLGMVGGEMKGSLIIAFEVEFPTKLTEEQKIKLKDIL